MNNKTKTILYITIFALFVLASVWGYNNVSSDYTPDTQPNDNASSQSENATVPKSTPDAQQNPDNSKKITPAINFTVLDAVGNQVKLSEKFGKPIILNFWASWCPPCKNEFPHFQKAYNRYKDKINFFMVDLVDGQRETIEKGKLFVREHKYTMPIYFDTTNQAAKAYRITSIPMTYFIDKEGNIVNLFQGQISEEKLLQVIENLLSYNVE
ncbi:MAG: TlpA family protein disulfide reductase [Clostridiaceae bacterium]|nr:TlpA family protein disulfide reductase [Clostridiaceae bacterium]